MKNKILEKLNLLNSYVQQASTSDLINLYKKCEIDSVIIASYAKIEADVLTTCCREGKIENASNSFTNDPLNDYALAA